MEINSLQIQSMMSQYSSQGSQTQNSNAQRMPPPPPPPSDISAGFSGAGMMMGMDSSSQAEMSDFHDTVMSAIESGKFDAEALAEEAPQALKDLAESQGEDLATMLEQMPQKMQEMGAMGQMGGMPPPPPGGMGQPSEEMDSFLDSIVEAVESGETDIATLLEEAPEELQAMAANLGTDVESLIEDMTGRIEEHGDPRERDPSTQRHNQQGLAAYAEQMTGDTTSAFMDALMAA